MTHAFLAVKPKVSSNRAIHKPSFDTSVISRSAGAGKGVTVGGSGGGASNKPQFSTQNRAQQKSLKLIMSIHMCCISNYCYFFTEKELFTY